MIFLRLSVLHRCCASEKTLLFSPRPNYQFPELAVGMIARAYRRASALVGRVSRPGTVEGRARVVLDVTQADREPDDILITAYTGPQLESHVRRDHRPGDGGGRAEDPRTVIAREYRLPGVVGVQRATRLVRHRQRTHVHGTDGYTTMAAASSHPWG